MPPAIFVAKDDGATGATAIAFVTPEQAKARDVLIAIVATANTSAGPDYAAAELDGWEEVAELTGSGSTIWILRREAQAGDTGNVSIVFDGGIPDPAIGVLLVFRNLDPSAAAVSSSATAIAASANFACPSRTLAAYSNLYLGIVLVNTTEAPVTPPAGCTERSDYGADGLELATFDLLAEATGATGTKTATTAGAETGIAASVAFAADPFVGNGLEFTFDPVGAIGLPSKGV